MKIIPAILPKSQSELSEKVSAVLGMVSMVQVDVCDGVFVPSVTKFHELPHADQIEYELDLMIDQPEQSIRQWIAMHPSRIIVHVESIRDQQKMFMALEQVRGEIEIGLSISNDTPNELLETYSDDCDFIQLMGIKNIGFQGEPFDERVLEKIKYFKDVYPDMPISVDGAVNLQTIQMLRDAGVTRFVCGSAVFDGNPAENIKNLQLIAEHE